MKLLQRAGSKTLACSNATAEGGKVLGGARVSPRNAVTAAFAYYKQAFYCSVLVVKRLLVVTRQKEEKFLEDGRRSSFSREMQGTQLAFFLVSRPFFSSFVCSRWLIGGTCSCMREHRAIIYASLRQWTRPEAVDEA